MNDVIEVKDLIITYGDNNAVLWKTNGSIPEKSLTAIVGPNGAGKSTLVKSIIGAIKPHKGETKINNKLIKDITQESKIDDDKELFCWTSVARVIFNFSEFNTRN